MSTYLELCQKFVKVTGITGASIASVLNNTGMNAKIVEWIADADNDIQTRHQDWKFLHTNKSMGLTSSVDEYTLSDLSITDLNFWDTKHFYINPQTANYRPLAEVDYYDWLSSRERLGVKSEREPTQFVIKPEHTIVFIDVPDTVYTVWAMYWKKPTKLAANADESAIPSQFEMAIIHRAKMYYGEFYEHWDMYKSAEKDFEGEMVKLEAAELPFHAERARGANETEDLVTEAV